MDLVTYALAKKYTEDTVKGAGALKGQDGDSAYQVAVKNGFVGTEQEWLDSLEGNGVDGISGNKDGSWTIVYTNGTTNSISNEAYNDLLNKIVNLEATKVSTVNGIAPDENGNVVVSSGEGEIGTSNYNDLQNKPKINGVELNGDKKISDLGVTYYSDLRDDSELLTYEETTDLINKINNGYIVPGFRDKYVIPDKRSTGVLLDSTFTKFIESGFVGVVKEGYEGEPCYISVDDGGYCVITWKNNENIADRILIENYDFSHFSDFYSLYTENFVPHQEKNIIVTFRNCKMGKIRLGKGKLYYKFEHCTFEGNVSGCNMNIDYGYFHNKNGDAINPSLNFTVTNSYIADLDRSSQSGATHIDGTQIFGTKDFGCENIHFENDRYSIPQFYHDGTNQAHVNGAIMFQVEFGPKAENVEFKNIMIDMGGSWYPCFATYYPDREFSNISFKNIVASDMYPSTFRSDNWTNGIAKISNSRIEPYLYVTSVWKDNYDQNLHLLCTNNSCQEDKILTVITDKDVYKFNIPRCPSQNELNTDPIYQTYEFEDMPYDIQIDIPNTDTTNFLVCYDGEKQIRYVNFQNENNFAVNKKILKQDYDNLFNKPTINDIQLKTDTTFAEIKEKDKYLEKEYCDIYVIPDEKNCGLLDTSKLTTEGFLHPDKLDAKNEHQNWRIYKDYDLIFVKNENNFYLDFSTAPTWQTTGTYLFENIDFSSINLHCGYNKFKSYRGGNLKLIFKNCKFAYLDQSDWKDGRNRGELKIYYENCEFTRFEGNTCVLRNCLIHNSSTTLGSFGKRVELYNCYIKNNEEDIGQPIKTEIYGIDINSDIGFYAKNCRIEVPKLNKTVDNGLPGAAINLQLSKHRKNYVFDHCYINGGNQIIKTPSYEKIFFVNPVFGRSVKNEDLTEGMFQTIRQGYSYKNDILISSIWTTDNELHFLATNEKNNQEKIKIFTNLGEKEYTIESMLLPSQYEPDSKNFNDLPIDKEYSYIGNIEYAIFTDSNNNIIRTWSKNGKKIPKLTSSKVDPFYKQEEITELNELKGNTLYVVNQPMENLTINSLQVLEGYCEYMFEFITSDSGCNLSLPSIVKWDGNSAPTLEANKKYQVSILNNIAIISKGVSI